MNGQTSEPTGNEWLTIGFQAQAALVHTYYTEVGRGRAMTTAATLGMPSAIRDGYVIETSSGGGYALTERGRLVLAQGDTMASRLLRRRPS